MLDFFEIKTPVRFNQIELTLLYMMMRNTRLKIYSPEI